MTNDIKALIDYYEREKGLSREKILLALESAFLSAYRKMVPGSGSINYLRAEINVDKGKVRIFADLEVVPDEEYSDKFNQIPLSLAVKLDKNAVLHDLLPTNITPKAIGRRGQNARLTSRLMGWDVQVRVFDVQEAEKRQSQAAAEEVMRQCQAAAKTLSEQLEIPEETAMGLVTMGGTDLVALTGFEASDIAESMGIPAEEAAQILNKARDLISQ